MHITNELEKRMTARHAPGIHQKLKAGKAAVAGLGGLGSHIAVMLARMGVGRLLLVDFDVVVSGTGVPGLIKSEMVGQGAVVVDAGTASEDGALVGDVDEVLRGRDDITITPRIGGVGPLTVTVLFERL